MSKFAVRKSHNLMNTLSWILIAVVVILFVAGLIIPAFKGEKKENPAAVNNDKMNYNIENESLKSVSYKVVVPLRIQACERLMLYLERIKFPILVKRIYQQGLSRDDFQFSLLQNVQDEFEHNLAQRLYVSEDTWQLVNLAKEEVLQNINAAFNDNADSDVASIAMIISSFQNPMAEKAIINIKCEFDSFLV